MTFPFPVSKFEIVCMATPASSANRPWLIFNVLRRFRMDCPISVLFIKMNSTAEIHRGQEKKSDWLFIKLNEWGISPLPATFLSRPFSIPFSHLHPGTFFEFTIMNQILAKIQN